MPPNIHELAAVLQKQAEADTGRKALATGFEIWTGAWNGMEGPYSIALHVNAGDQSVFRDFPNCVTLYLPRAGAES